MVSGRDGSAEVDRAAVAARLDAELSSRGWMVGFGPYTRRFWARWARSDRPVWLTAETSEELQERMRTHRQALRMGRAGRGEGTAGMQTGPGESGKGAAA